MSRVSVWACGASAALVSAAWAGAPAVTIYNQNFAVVRDTVALNLSRGVNDVTYNQITAHVEPDSVILRDPAGKRRMLILEQNYRADPISQDLLLNRYEGQEIEFLIPGDEPKKVRGRIIRSGYVPHTNAFNRYGNAYAQRQMAYAYNPGGQTNQPIIEVEGVLRFSLPGQPLFPALSDDSILKPTLTWKIETDGAGPLDAELAYITGGMSWEASYNVTMPEDADALDLIGWVTMDNQSGKTFDNAKIKLMAGDVSKLQQQDGFVGASYLMSARASSSEMAPPVTEQAFDEYHLYTLERSTTLRDRETKQVEFIRAENVPSAKLLVYEGAWIDWNRYRHWGYESIRQDRDYGTQCNPKVWVMREFENRKEHHLGMPLPKGRLRFYRKAADGQLEFTGENVIDHTPKDETVRVYTGNAFDVIGERVRTDYRIDTSANWLDESFRIELRNHKDEPVEIRVVERLYRWINWEIVEQSDEFEKKDSQKIEFRVTVPANGKHEVTYKAHYTW